MAGRVTNLFSRCLKHGCLVRILEILNSVDILYLPLSPDTVYWNAKITSVSLSSLRYYVSTHSSLVRAFPRIRMRQLSSGDDVARGSYKPRTVRAESSSLS